MEERKNNIPPYLIPEERRGFPTGKREMIFLAVILAGTLAMANSVYAGGFNLGFSIAVIWCMAASVGYLLAGGYQGNGYIWAIWGLCGVIAAGFARSDDGFVKFVMICFLLTGGNLALGIMAGQNRRDPGGVRSLLDAPRTLFVFGVEKMNEAFRGVGKFFRDGGEASRRTGAILAGAAIAVPVLAVVIPLLISADAAFSGVMDLLPDFELAELVATVFFGGILFAVLYTRGVSLKHREKNLSPEKEGKRLHPATVNTVLTAVCFVYLVYLVSQLAYFVGGFSGILPEGYSTAEYARRGFFEMAWLCAINLGIMTFSMGLVARQEKAPKMTRLLCLFIGSVTLFLVAASCAKMVMYIGTYGLTRLRVMTMTIIVFLGITTALVSVWLFVPKLQYMKVITIVGLAMGAAVFWMDVDTQVAKYYVNAYLSGKLETVDVHHLGNLGSGAVPYIEMLIDAPDKSVAETAEELLENWYISWDGDIRGWNYVNLKAEDILERYQESEQER